MDDGVIRIENYCSDIYAFFISFLEDLDDIEYTNPSAMAEDSNEGKVVNEKNEHTIYLRIIEDAKK